MKKIKVITICSSVTFYDRVIEIRKLLNKKGVKVITPKGVVLRSKDRRFKDESFKKKFEAVDGYKVKSSLIRDHFNRIQKADSILIVNEEKKSLKGYIGANVLMEMAIAFNLKMPIFILNKPSEQLSNYDEVMGMLPIILNGDIEKI